MPEWLPGGDECAFGGGWCTGGPNKTFLRTGVRSPLPTKMHPLRRSRTKIVRNAEPTLEQCNAKRGYDRRTTLKFPRRASIATRLFLALLLAMGAVTSSLGAGGCPSVEGDQALPQKEQHQESSKHSTGEAESLSFQPEGDCCCVTSARPAAAPSSTKLAAPSMPVFAANAPPDAEVCDFVPIGRVQVATFYSDKSPPSVAWHPDFGRAPPLA